MFLWTSQWRLIQRTHWIFQPSPHSHQAVDLFFSSSWCFFKHVKQTHVPFPSPNRQALHVGLSPGWHQLCFLTFLVVFSKEFKVGVIYLFVLQMFSAAEGWSVLARQPGKRAWLLPELYFFWRNMFLQLWVWKFYSHWLCVVFLSSWRIWPLLSFHAVWDKYLPKPTGSSPNPMPLGKQNAPLLYSYNVQAQSKHWMLHPLNALKFEY